MIITTFFFARKKQYNILLKVWENSLKKAMPGQKFKIIKMKKPPDVDHKRDTAAAFLEACEYALKSNECLAICDCDLMFLKDITDIEKEKFDIAITVRDRQKMRYNTGLWFFKPTNKARLFIQEWVKFTKKLLNNFTKKEDFCWKHGGIDQASLYLTIRKNNIIKRKAKILELPCEKWNLTQSEWNHYKAWRARVVHVKSQLRLAIFKKDYKIPEHFRNMHKLIDLWRSFL